MCLWGSSVAKLKPTCDGQHLHEHHRRGDRAPELLESDIPCRCPSTSCPLHARCWAGLASVPTKDSVKTEPHPPGAATPLKTRGASICDGFPPLNLSRTKPADGGRAAAPRHLLFLPGDRAVDTLFDNHPRHPAWPTEFRFTRISDSDAVESDLFSVSSGYADWQRACASFESADSSLLEQGELERADQALGDP